MMNFENCYFEDCVLTKVDKCSFLNCLFIHCALDWYQAQKTGHVIYTGCTFRDCYNVYSVTIYIGGKGITSWQLAETKE